jgi:hypothetical protein
VNSGEDDVFPDATRMSVWHAIYIAQTAAEAMRMQYFHRDPMTIYCRAADGQMYLTVKAVFTDDERVEIHLKLNKGSPEQLDEFRERCWRLSRG